MLLHLSHPLQFHVHVMGAVTDALIFCLFFFKQAFNIIIGDINPAYLTIRFVWISQPLVKVLPLSLVLDIKMVEVSGSRCVIRYIL